MTTPRIRQNILLLAEAFDAWRVIPRLMILAYGYLVFNLYLWYKNIPTYVQEKCDGSILSDLMAQGKSMAEIKQYACTVVDVVGGPTAAQSTFVTTIIGLSTGIFGLYTATGRKWDGWEPNFVYNDRDSRDSEYAPKDRDDDSRGAGGKSSRPAKRPAQTIQIFASGDSPADDNGPKP